MNLNLIKKTLFFLILLSQLVSCGEDTEFGAGHRSVSSNSLTPNDDNPGDNGATYNKISDSFSQNTATKPALDILWVVDNSGSMGNEQASLAYNFDVFIKDFVTKNIDFQMGITTTDSRVGYNGVAVGAFSLLNANAAKLNLQSFLNYFSSMIEVGITGSGTEKGLNGAQKFLENYGPAWLHPDAYLVIVQVSDEEDQSSDSVNNYINHLKSLKSDNRKIVVHSIVTTTYETGDPSIGNRYMQVSQALNGTVSNIKNNFYNTLKNIGGSILNLISSFALSQRPYNNLLSIYVNGNKVTTGWSYDSVTNSVRFTSGHEPVEGANIRVEYNVEVL